MPQHFNGQKSGQKGWPIGGISRHHWKIHWKHDGSKFGFTVGFQAHLSTFAMQEWIHNHLVVLPTVCIQPMAVITEDRTQTLGVAFQTFHGRLEILRTKWRFVAGKSDKWRAFHCYVWLPNSRVPPRKPHTLWLSYPSDSRKKKTWCVWAKLDVPHKIFATMASQSVDPLVQNLYSWLGKS